MPEAVKTGSAELQVAKKVVRRMFNPTPLTEKRVTEEAKHMLWALDLYGYKVVPRD